VQTELKDQITRIKPNSSSHRRLQQNTPSLNLYYCRTKNSSNQAKHQV